MATSPDTAQQVMAGIRYKLRQVDDVKLPDTVILKQINDCLKSYLQQESLAMRDRRTEVAPITITALDEPAADFSVTLTGVSDFEVQALEVANSTGPNFYWCSVKVVPIEAFAALVGGNQLIAAFYGSNSLSTPCKVKLNILDSSLPAIQFRLTYRLPLLTIVQEGDKPPIPSAHLPMLEYDAALQLAPQINDTSADWIGWMGRALPGYAQKYLDLREDWKAYLDSSSEPQVQPIRRNDRHRSRYRTTRGTIVPIN